MRIRDRVALLEIGDRARDADDFRVGARAEAEAFDGAGNEVSAFVVERCDGRELARREHGVTPRNRLLRARAVELDLACRHDALAYGKRSLSGRAPDERVNVDRGKADVNIEPIEQRPGESS